MSSIPANPAPLAGRRRPRGWSDRRRQAKSEQIRQIAQRLALDPHCHCCGREIEANPRGYENRLRRAVLRPAGALSCGRSECMHAALTPR